MEEMLQKIISEEKIENSLNENIVVEQVVPIMNNVKNGIMKIRKNWQ